MARKKQPHVLESPMERHASMVLAATVAVLPLVFWPVARDPNLAKSVFLSIATAVTVLLSLRIAGVHRSQFRANMLDLCVSLYAVMVFGSWIYSFYRHATIAAMSPVFVCTVLYFLGRNIMCSEVARGRIVTGLLLGCLAVSALGIVQRFGGLGWGDPRWIGSTWFNRTFLTAYLLLLLPVAGWALRLGTNRLKWLGAVCLIAGLLALFYTRARVAWMATVPMACAAVFVAWTISSPRGRRRILANAGLLILGAVVLQVVLMHALPSRAPLAVVARALGRSAPGNEQRLALITAAVRVGLDRPLLGGGAGTFPVYAPERVPPRVLQWRSR